MDAIYTARGDYGRAIDILQWNVVSLVGERLRERFGLPGLAFIHSRFFLAWSLAELGEFVEGKTCAEEAVQIAEAADHAFSLDVAYRGVSLLFLYKGDFHRAVPVLERAIALCQAANFSGSLTWLTACLGAAYALSGRLTEATLLLEQVVEQGPSVRMVYQSLWVGWLSKAYLLAGRLENAHALAGEHQERGHQAYALCLLSTWTKVQPQFMRLENQSCILFQTVGESLRPQHTAVGTIHTPKTGTRNT